MNTHRFMIMMLTVAGLAAWACAGPNELRLTSSPDIPGAQSTAKISTNDNGNTKIDLVVEHLASPERVDPGATTYVVWVRGNEAEAEPQNLGQLKIGDDEKGSISATTTLRSFDLYITAEPTQLSTAPKGKTLLYTTVAMK
jgi:hypothetical protein